MRVWTTVAGCGILLSGCGPAAFSDRPARLHFADPKDATPAAVPGDSALVAAGETQRATVDKARERAAVLRLNTEDAVLDYYHRLDAEDERRRFRDVVIWKQLRADDKSFGDFTRRLQSDRAVANLSGDGGVIFLNGLAAMTGTAADKAALSVLSAMLISSRGSVDRELFLAQTMSALLTRMTAARKEALLPILEGIRQSDASYPLDRALRDLLAYADAGSLLSAVRAVATDAGVANRAAGQAVAEEVRTSAFLSSLDAREAVSDRVDALKGQQLIALAFAVEHLRAALPADVQEELRLSDPGAERFKDAERARTYLQRWLADDSAAGGAEWVEAVALAEKAKP